MPLPSAQTESARELRRAFFCELCQKGYARINEFEAHEGSYDHQHRKRLKDMKALTRNPTAAVKDRRAEKKRNENSEMISVNLKKEGGGGGKGFRNITRDRVEEERKGAVKEEKEREREAEVRTEEEGERWEMRPVPWEELQNLDGGILDKFEYKPQRGPFPPEKLKGADLDGFMKELERVEMELEE